MATYKKQTFISGKYANKSELYDKEVKKAKIVSETSPEESITYKDLKGNPKIQDVCKVMFDGYTEAFKVSLNRATINALVDAFGENSSDWQGHTLAVEIDKLPGKKFPLYLIPEGYKRIEDEKGYSVIVNSNVQGENIEAENTGY